MVLSATVGCHSDLEPQASAERDLAGLRERYVDRFNTSVESKDDGAVDAELRRLAAIYRYLVVDHPRKKGGALFIVQDEAGKPIDGVDLRFKSLFINPGFLAMEPIVRHESRMNAGATFHKEWPASSYSLEVDVSKPGYRTVRFTLWHPPGGEDRNSYSRSQSMLFEGYVLPPERIDGPIRIVMPPTLNWDPSSPRTHSWETGSVDQNLWPKQPLALDANPVVSSAAPRRIAVPKRGTYVLLDKAGRTVTMQRLDRGNRIGLRVRTSDGLISMSYPGVGSLLSDNNPPYQWQLYSEPKLRQTLPEDIRQKDE